MFDRIKSLIDRWNTLKEIDALSEHELSDLGMTRDQVRRFVQMPADVADRVAHMAAIFGLSDADLHKHHDAYVTLLETCGGCRERRACSRVLALGEAASPGMCSFCLNAESFATAA